MSSSAASGTRLVRSGAGTASVATTTTSYATSTIGGTGSPFPTAKASTNDAAVSSTLFPPPSQGAKRPSISIILPTGASSGSKTTQQHNADKSYLAKRKLHRHVSTWELWGFCVGVVICGEYTGWQGGLASGWINLAVSTILSIVIYAGALWSEVDMCTALPFSSAHTAFAHAAFGPAVGAMNGFIVMISFAQQAATNVAIISRYVKRIFDLPAASVYALWIFFYAIMVFVNLNSKRFFRSTLLINSYCCLALFGYMIWAGSRMPAIADWTWLSFTGTDQFTAELSLVKVIDCLPYAIWWFVGIEAFPVVAEELESVQGSTSRAVNWGMSTLFFYSVTLVWIAPVMPPFSPALASTDYPIGLSILQALFGIDPQIDPHVFDLARRILFLLLLLWAQGVTPTANIYATSRYMYGLSRGGLLPTSLSLTNESFTDVVTSLANQAPLPPSLKQLFLKGRHTSGDDDGSHRVSFGAASRSPDSHPPLNQSSMNRRTNNTTANLTANDVLASLHTSNPSHDRTPVRAVLASALLAYGFNWILELLSLLQSFGPSDAGPSTDQAAFDKVVDLLLRVAVWFACISHAVQFAAYIRIRLAIKGLDRPAPSPIGITGAILAFLVVILFGIVGPFVLGTSVYWASAVLLVVATSAFLVYFERFARPRLKNSPERLFIRSILKQRHASADALTVDVGAVTGGGATTAELGMMSTTLPAVAPITPAPTTDEERDGQAARRGAGAKGSLALAGQQGGPDG
ncbi:hypothetical protein BCR44DRAFT_71019 [Catenaria anguillulae PL171]|uniref:Amino acid permease/ SLC12A domain-containing protein n=1 Tax=Catenaria anguillulae PL171 TaxID=765915 RepID=A0A1Y2HZW5_9FUNG|nr:hypothetical protein BCR44DRAFT_71019 [Catenaria anguillulae PL171]